MRRDSIAVAAGSLMRASAVTQEGTIRRRGQPLKYSRRRETGRRFLRTYDRSMFLKLLQ